MAQKAEHCVYRWDLGFCECVRAKDHDGHHQCKCFDTLSRGTVVCPVCLDGSMHTLPDQMKNCPACKGRGRIRIIEAHEVDER